MFWLIGFLTVLLVVDCLLLCLLILVQLPKKEAGLGQAFGGATTDALFGAGSGNALTNMTKYATIVFFVLTLSVSILYGHQARSKRTDLERALIQGPKASLPTAPAPAEPATKGSNAVSAQAPGLLKTPAILSNTAAQVAKDASNAPIATSPINPPVNPVVTNAPKAEAPAPAKSK